VQLTRGSEYAIRGMLYLARQPRGRKVMTSEVARAADVPESFLAKVLQVLARAGIVESFRGTGGGFALIRPAGEISLRQVIEAVEGNIALNKCLVHQDACKRVGACPTHKVWQEAQEQLLNVLNKANFADLARYEAALERFPKPSRRR
jgi:Rrf2 family iron-sulfur cluster assembly transcriptional regulator